MTAPVTPVTVTDVCPIMEDFRIKIHGFGDGRRLVSGLVLAPFREYEKLPKEAMFAQQTITGRGRRLVEFLLPNASYALFSPRR
jgi:hypothetical protein